MRRHLFRLGCRLTRPRILHYYDKLIDEENSSLEKKKRDQLIKLKVMINFCIENVPYYTDLFKKERLSKESIQSIADLRKLPILTKDDIRNNVDKFIPKNLDKMNYIVAATGGSTGTPLKYRMSQDDIDLGMAELYFDWHAAGYELGDKIAILAGGSIVGKKTSLTKKVKAWLKGHRSYSSYGLSNELLESYLKDMSSWNITFLRGYPTAIYRVAKYIEENNYPIEFNIRSVITTAEMLLPKHKECIERVFKAPVFDNYGLGDGGISAYECHLHRGFHINMDRSILEVINHERENVFEEEGKILATSLINFSMPFLRYDTGDLGVLSKTSCSCGQYRPILKKILGRTTDILDIGGITIGGPMLATLMQQVHARMYRFIQTGAYEIEVIIVKDVEYSEKDERYIQDSLQSQTKRLKLLFNYVDDIPITGDEKFKVVINNYN